ncbi:MAG: Ig domain-containing protein [Spirochaetaceae bacterium]|nr:Ig domain-containing protein [Spirochaetaceae bacterium]
MIALAAALTAAGIVLAGCQGTAVPEVRFPAKGLTVAIPGMTVGKEVSYPLPAATGGESLVYSLSPAVPGLAFDPATRVLSGTPTTPGVYPMTYTAKDPATGGTMESVRFTVTVAASPRTDRDRILGTWRVERGWGDDNRGVEDGTIVDYVTFTASRYVLERGHYDDFGAFVYVWHSEGTWELGDEEIVQILYGNHDDNDETPHTERRLAKPYFLISDDELIVGEWADDSPPGSAWNTDWMTRVNTSAYIPPIGVWNREDEVNVHTMTVSADGSFSWRTDEPDGVWMLTASWTHDPDHLFLNLSNVIETWTPHGGPPEDIGDTDPAPRIAYVPSRLIAGQVAIRTSSFYPESMPDEFPHGGYWEIWTLQAP